MSLLLTIDSWLQNMSVVRSAVLFGSSARWPDKSINDIWSDIDIHIVSRGTIQIGDSHWKRYFSADEICVQAIRPASGGATKHTVILTQGQIDLIVVPLSAVTIAELLSKIGLHKRIRSLQIAMAELATCLHSGYRFIKGEKRWGAFYAKAARLPGVRLSNEDVEQLAEIFLCDLLWVFQKIDRGELIAAQLVLHGNLQQTILRFWRELSLRRGIPLPSFGLGRRIEMLALPTELKYLRVSALGNREQLNVAAWQLMAAIKYFIHQLAPTWKIKPAYDALLQRFLNPTSAR